MNQVLALKRVADLTIKGDVLRRGSTSCTRTKYLTKFFLICFTPVSVVIKNFHSKAVCSFCHSTTNSSQANNANGWSTNFTSKIAMQMKKLFLKKNNKTTYPYKLKIEMERSIQLKTQLMQLLKESPKKIQAELPGFEPCTLSRYRCIALYNWACSNLPGKHEDDKVHPPVQKISNYY